MNLSRRKFLSKITVAIAGTAGLMGSCQSPAEKNGATEKNAGGSPAAEKNAATGPANGSASAKTDCNDLSMLTQEELQVRQQFGYESPSSSPDRQCGNCALYILPSADRPCAGCMLFKGPVRADGSCIQFAAKVQQ